MKLRELNESIATACKLKPRDVAAVHTETFSRIAAALEKGERVTIADFGIFTVREVPGEDGAPAKKIVRFRQREAGAEAEAGAGAEKPKAKGDRKKRKAQAAGEAAQPAVLAEAGE